MSEENYMDTLNAEELFTDSVLEAEEQNAVEAMNLFGLDTNTVPAEESAPTELFPNEYAEMSESPAKGHNQKKSRFVWPKTRIEECSGTCGDSVQWYLTTDCRLSITGTGKMHDFECRQSPWYLYYPFIKEIDIAEGITRIGNHAFEGCFVRKLSIPDTVKEIGNSACKGCIYLEKVQLPDSVELIEDSAFSGCTVMEDTVIPESVQALGAHAFAGCLGFRHIAVPGTLQSIGVSAFAYCEYAESVMVNEPIQEIPDDMFACCGFLESARLPSTLKKIGAYVFANDRHLWEVKVPETCEVDSRAFAHTFMTERGEHLDAHEMYLKQYEKQMVCEKKPSQTEHDNER